MTSPATRDMFARSVEIESQRGIDPVGSAIRSLNDTLGKTLTERREERLPAYTAHMEYRDGITTALYEGKVARFTGETMDRCTYARGTEKFQTWREGWAEADEELRDMTAEDVREEIARIYDDFLREAEDE